MLRAILNKSWQQHPTRPNNNQQKKFKKKRACETVDFAVPADRSIKLKECEKKDKYLDLAREMKNLWDMQVTIIPIVIGAFGTVTKGLLKGLVWRTWKLADEWRPSKLLHYWERPKYREESCRLEKTSSSSSYRAGSTYIPDPLSPLLPIVHRPR